MGESRICVSLAGAVFFFKQKTAYDVLRSLVGSEMCIRDRSNTSSAFKERYSADKLVALYASSDAIVSEDAAGINSSTMIKIGNMPVKASALLSKCT